MQITKSKASAIEADALKLAVIAREYHQMEPVYGKTPLDEILEQEERESVEISDSQETAIKVEAISGLLSFLFRPTSGKLPSPVEVLQRLYLLVYSVRPSLIEGWSLQKIADTFESSRQCFSKRLLKQNELLGGLRSRNQKSVTSVSVYRENTREWHAERIRKEREEARKEYLRRWRAANAAEVRAYQTAYRAKHRERLNAAKRAKR